MTEDRGGIKIRYTLKQGEEDALSSETERIFPISRWKIFLISVPVFIAAAFISAFFFSIFFPLLLFGGIFHGFWVWRLRKSNRVQSLEGGYVLVIVECGMSAHIASICARGLDIYKFPILLSQVFIWFRTVFQKYAPNGYGFNEVTSVGRYKSIPLYHSVVESPDYFEGWKIRSCLRLVADALDSVHLIPAAAMHGEAHCISYPSERNRNG